MVKEVEKTRKSCRVYKKKIWRNWDKRKEEENEKNSKRA